MADFLVLNLVLFESTDVETSNNIIDILEERDVSYFAMTPDDIEKDNIKKRVTWFEKESVKEENKKLFYLAYSMHDTGGFYAISDSVSTDVCNYILDSIIEDKFVEDTDKVYAYKICSDEISFVSVTNTSSFNHTQLLIKLMSEKVEIDHLVEVVTIDNI